MLKLKIETDEIFKLQLLRRIHWSRMDKEFCGKVTDYFFENIRILARIMEGMDLWTERKLEGPMANEAFVLSLMKLMDSLRENMYKNDGLVELYLSRMDLPEALPATVYSTNPWYYGGQSGHYSSITGVYQALLDLKVKQEDIDRFYLDGTLLEIYDEGLNILPGMINLTRTDNPSPYDLRDGLMSVENRFRGLLYRFFAEDFDGCEGLWGCFTQIFRHLMNEREKSNEHKG